MASAAKKKSKAKSPKRKTPAKRVKSAKRVKAEHIASALPSPTMGPKYEFTGETKVVSGVTLRRIRALVAIAAIGVNAGDLGGWIESEKNLSQVFGNAWVSGNARVFGNARVSGDAQVYGDARVSGNALVYGDARVYGDAQVSGNAWVEKPIICATRTDGYTFTCAKREKQPPVIIAGCRYFTFDEARKHWQSTRAGTPLGDESLALVDHLERMARIQGWLE